MTVQKVQTGFFRQLPSSAAGNPEWSWATDRTSAPERPLLPMPAITFTPVPVGKGWEQCVGTWSEPLETYEEDRPWLQNPRASFDMGMCFSCGHAYALNGDGRLRKHRRPQGVHCRVGYHPGGCVRDGEAVPDNYRGKRAAPTPAPTPGSRVTIHDRYQTRRVRVARGV